MSKQYYIIKVETFPGRELVRCAFLTEIPRLLLASGEVLEQSPSSETVAGVPVNIEAEQR